VNQGDLTTTYRRRHLVRSGLRVVMLGCVAAGILPLLSWFFGEFTVLRPVDFTRDLFRKRWRYEEEGGFFLAMLAMAIILRILEKRLVKWLVPLVRPECPECGYALIQLTEPRCPECGLRLPPELISGNREEH